MWKILQKKRATFWQKIEIAELCKRVHCVDLGESFQTNIYSRNLASLQPRTSPVKSVRTGQPVLKTRPRAGAGAPAPGPARGAVAGWHGFRLAPAWSSGCGKVYRARSRLYRNEILQVNTLGKALAEICTMHSFAPFSILNFFVKNCWNFCWLFIEIIAKFAKFCWIFATSWLPFFQDVPKMQQCSLFRYFITL